MAKLKCTSHPKIANTKHQFPLIGHVQFDKDSVIEVDDKLVNKFLEIKCGFEFEVIGSKKKVKKVDNEVEDITDNEVESETPEKDAYLEGLKELSIEELNALISARPVKETKSLKNKESKIDYLVSKQFA